MNIDNTDYSMLPLSPYNKEQWHVTAFLAENPEAFSFVSEAEPVVLDNLIIAADGLPTQKGMIPPTFHVTSSNIQDLFEGVYGGILEACDESYDILVRNLMSGENGCEHLVSRYVAVMSEVLALNVMRETPTWGSDTEYYASRLGAVITSALAKLKKNMTDIGGLSPGAASYFSSSLAICRIDNLQSNEFAITMFGAGTFTFYLLDKEGMKPLWEEDLPLLEASDAEATLSIASKTVHVKQDAPFAILILSDGVCSSSTETLAVPSNRNFDALVWRYRMKLEEKMLRVIINSQREELFSSRAEQFFSGHIAGFDSASGAMLIIGTSYENFCTNCRERLEALETTLTLLPDGYDMENPPTIMEFDDAESGFFDELYAKYNGLKNTTSVILSKHVKALLFALEDGSHPSGIDDDILPFETVKNIFREFDCDNDNDREQIGKNKDLINELLAENWITLRPIMCAAGSRNDDVSENSCRELNNLRYQSCLDMNSILADIYGKRHKLIKNIYEKLSACHEILKTEEENLVYGRVCDDTLENWLETLILDIPSVAYKLENFEKENKDRSRSIFSAYSSLRNDLFLSDTSNNLVPYYSYIIDGSADAGIWSEIEQLCSGMIDSANIENTIKLLSMIRVISESCGKLYDRIESRAADKRTIQRITSDVKWNKTCLMAVLREFPGWEDIDGARIDDNIRNEYRTMVRRWRETLALINKQNNAFDMYYNMYTMYTFFSE